MAPSSGTGAYLKMLEWFRACRPIWTHFTIRSVVLRAPDGLRALWTNIVLSDSDAPPDATPDVQLAPDLVIVRSAAPFERLPALLRSLRKDCLPEWATQVPEPIMLSWTASRHPEVGEFRREPSAPCLSAETIKEPHRPWSRYESGVLSFDVGQLSPWFQANPAGYEWMHRLDDQARLTGCSDLHDLGRRLGLVQNQQGSRSERATPTLRVIAPFLVRVAEATANRHRGTVIATVTRSSRVTDRTLLISLSELDHPDKLRPPTVVPKGVELAEITFDDVDAGKVEIRLQDPALGTVSRKKGVVRERYRRAARAVIGEIIDGGLDKLRTDLEAARGVGIERPLRDLLFLLGWSPKGLPRNARQPPHLVDGIVGFDILALSRQDTVLLAVECSEEWQGNDKLGKLVGRAKALGEVLAKRLAEPDVPRVRPVLAVTKPRSLASEHLLEAARNHGVGTIGQEDIDDLIDCLARDEPASTLRKRFGACFPDTPWEAAPNTLYGLDECDDEW